MTIFSTALVFFFFITIIPIDCLYLHIKISLVTSSISIFVDFALLYHCRSSEMANQMYNRDYSEFLHKLSKEINKEENYAVNLRKLFSIREELLKQLCEPDLWATQYLNNVDVIAYLKNVIEGIVNSNNAELWNLLKKIVNPIDLHLILHFNSFQFIMEWLGQLSTTSYQKAFLMNCDTFTALFLIVEDTCQQMQRHYSSKPSLNDSAYFKNIVKYKDVYSKYLRETNQLYDLLLLQIILLPLNYDPVSNEFRNVGQEELSHFLEQDESNIEKFYSLRRSALKIQAFLFYLALSHYTGPYKNRIALLYNFMVHAKTILKDVIYPEIHSIFMICSGNTVQLKKYFEIVWAKDFSWNTVQALDMIRHSTEMQNMTLERKPKTFLPCLQENSLSDILKKLNIVKLYPQKITMKDALVVNHKLCLSEVTLQTLPIIVLEKIMVCDTRSRSFLIPIHKPSSSIQESESDDSESDSDNDLEEKSIHPVDVILALLLCSDNFLRQILLHKMSLSQLGIPLLLPDKIQGNLTFLLWGLRLVEKTWKAVDKSGKIFSQCCSVVDYKGPIVTFLRCGNLSVSKSKLLNDIIGKEDVFFHWDLESQPCSKVISQGAVDICCYYPYENDEYFKNAVIFANLHGDAKEQLVQIAFLEKISFMSFILMDTKSLESGDADILNILQSLANLPGGATLILVDTTSYKKRTLKKIIKNCDLSVICMKGKPSAQIQADIKQHIANMLRGNDSFIFSSLAEFSYVARKLHINIDEDDDNCKRGKEKANFVKNLIEDNTKSILLPLQGGNTWLRWAALNKEMHRTEKKPIDVPLTQYVHLQTENAQKIRVTQCQTAVSSFFYNFLLNLLGCKGNERNYFLHWLQHALHNRMINSDLLSQMRNQYQQTIQKLKNIPSNSQTTASIKQLQNTLQRQNRKLLDVTLTLENCFKEIGQVYEAVKESTQHTNFIKILPTIAAETLMDGFALELMDGESSHVPITWVCDVIKCLKNIIGDKNLFILSILGVQSSGKSTLLNTMFGLRFRASAGRCTQGAFIQLLTLDSALKGAFNCDYLVIIDTEGLRAPELSSEVLEKHDNEIATFVIGIGDFTIINIYGETPSDISDILQTVIHAFIRMKEVSKNPGCIFVHQNVTEQLASERLKAGKQVLLEKLNRLTRDAAKLEHCETQYSGFRDVINFNEDRDIYYFTSLWKGDPPMAPINLGYSVRAQELKQAILSIANRQAKYCNFSGLEHRIKTLWEAILKENFVFNFKNTTEIAAYGALDMRYGHWRQKVQDILESLLIKCENSIKGCVDEEIDSVTSYSISDASTRLKAKTADLTEELKTFVEEHELSMTLSKWQHAMRRRLMDLCDESINTIKNHCNRTASHKKNENAKHKMLLQYEDKLRSDIAELIATLQLVSESKSNDPTAIEHLFKENWNQWIREFSEKVKPIKYPYDQEIDNTIENCLRDRLEADQKLLNLHLLKKSITDRSQDSQETIWEVDMRRHVDQKIFSLKVYSPSTKTTISKFASQCIESSLELLSKKLSTANMFNNIMIESIIDKIIKDIDDHNTESKLMNYTSEFKVEICLHVCSRASKYIKRWITDLRKQNDTVSSLQSQESRFFTIFKNKYLKVATEKAAAIQLCNSLTDAITDSVRKVSPIIISRHLRDSNPNFNNKQGFKHQVLVDLAKSENFKLYRKYFLDSSHSFKKWSLHYIETLCCATNAQNVMVFDQLMKKETDSIMEMVLSAVRSSKCATINDWLKMFCEPLQGKLELQTSVWIKDLKDIDDNSESIEFFKKCLVEELIQEFNSIQRTLKLEFLEICESASEKFLENVIGKTCVHQCPFCQEQCDMLNSEHMKQNILHKVTIHRPQCIGKMTWLNGHQLVLDICNNLVGSNNRLIILNEDGTEKRRLSYKNYKKIYPDWSISSEKDCHPPTYWMWVVCRFYEEILAWTNGVETEIPPVWKRISKEDAINSLSKIYN